jgi:hypothetical protein
MSKKGCPRVKLNYDEIVDAAKDAVLAEYPSLAHNPVEAEVNKMGALRLVEPNIDSTQFVIGYVTIPTVVNFATKMMQLGIVFPQVDMAVSRIVAGGVTLLATLLSGGKSFLLGSFLGQFTSTMDALTDVGISAIVKARQEQSGSQVKGIGASPEEELLKLRRDLERLSGPVGEVSREMEGILRVA